jgi:hypothetical protein
MVYIEKEKELTSFFYKGFKITPIKEWTKRGIYYSFEVEDEDGKHRRYKYENTIKADTLKEAKKKFKSELKRKLK